jgi:peptidoglycan hydrolase FlgJ
VAISPPSDLVLDVLRAADPTEVQAAQSKLKATRAAFAANSLAAAGTGFSSAVELLDGAASKSSIQTSNKTTSKSVEMPEEYRKFEASILQNFVNSMMPKEGEEVYGKGSAGEFWQSMMSEQIADQMSKNGGIGIAEQVFSQQLKRARGETPDATTNEDSRNQAVSMITDFERKVFDLAPTERGEA